MAKSGTTGTWGIGVVILTALIGQVPKTPTKGIIVALLLIAGMLFMHSLFNLNWIKRSDGFRKFIRRCFATLVIATGLYGVGAWSWPELTTPFIRPYDLTKERRNQLKKMLSKQTEQRAVLRFGCLAWSESACIAAGRFLLVFSEAGWKIDGNKVYRLDSSIPNAGVSLVSRTEKDTPPDLPPHMGMWHQMTPSEITIWTALTVINISPRGSTEKDLPENILGVYFGPEPQATQSSQ